jgi:phosphatidylserine/phosphatidylglycerophosphate/cardiolipin synthase-like enzyme
MSPKDNKATRTFQEQNGGPYRDWPSANLAKLAFRLARLPDRLGARSRLGQASPVGGAAEIHYAPAEDLEIIDVALFREATKQIDMAAYVLTDSAVIEALREAAARGVKVRVWRDAGEAARLSEFDVEAQLGGRVQGLELRSSAPGGELMHLKGYCVDHRLLRTGSANFSRSGETRQDNDLVALRGSSARAGFDAKFGRGWRS